MKKLSVVAVAMCLFVGSAFASWDYFPPKEAGKGEAKLGFGYAIGAETSSKLSIMDLSVAGRYSIIEGLEAAVILPVPLSASNDGNSVDGFAGLSIPEIGVRYWLSFGLGFFLDFGLPVDTRYDKNDLAKVGYEPAMQLGVGAQYSTNFTEELSLGSQLGLTVPFAGSDSKIAEGMGLGIGVEVDYSLGMVTPFLGVDVALGLTAPTFDGNEIPDAEAAEAAVDVTIGASASFTDNIGADLSIKLGVVGNKEFDLATSEEKSFIPITIGVHFSYSF